MTDSAALPSMDNPEFDQLDAILDDMRQRDEEIPQWEFLEGAMAALACAVWAPISAAMVAAMCWAIWGLRSCIASVLENPTDRVGPGLWQRMAARETG